MKTKLLTLILILPIFSYRQIDTAFYYYYKGEKIPLHLDKNIFYISSNNDFDKERIKLSDFSPFELKSENTVTKNEVKKWTKLELRHRKFGLFNDHQYQFHHLQQLYFG